MISFMKPVIDFFKEQEEPSYAALVGTNLVVSLTQSEKPIVWRVDFQEIKSAFFSIEAKGKKHQLVMQDKGNNKKDVIAEFQEEAHARHAYHLISKALLGQSTKESQASFFQTFVIFVVSFILLYWIMDSLFFSADTDQNATKVVKEMTPMTMEQSEKQPTIPEDTQKGVPLSVDDLLSR